MGDHDFRANEKSVTLPADDTLTIVLETTAGERKVLLESLPVLAGEVVDATVMQAANLRAFLINALARAKAENVLFSVHLKATMMKVSDPIIFGHVVKAYFADVFDKYGDDLAAAGLSANDGLGAILAGLASLRNGAEIKAAFEAALASGPRLSYVNSDKGITNLHVPSDVIVDASMPALIRNGGKLWGVDGAEDDTLAVIPDSSYSGVYATVIEDVKRNGPLDPATIGTVPNVGLMAQAAEEYGSHNKTFEIPADGTVTVVNQAGEVLLAHDVEVGDIWRACQTKDIPVRDWVKLAVTRARAAQTPAIFWLDESRAHDAELIKKVNAYLPEHDTAGLEIQILSPELATAYSLERMRQGLDTISVTGNVLRDYNTDLFPILEVGTSAKMLSIVPLIAGGGLFETGAGGSAPKHVQQLVAENYLRWDSLGEFFALVPSLRAVRRLRRPAGREGAGRHARPRDRRVPRRGPQPGPQARHARQPRLALLPGAVLGPGAGQADRRRRDRGGVQGAGRDAGGEGARHRRRAPRGPGQAGRHRRLLPARRREDRRRDAPLEDLQRRARSSVTCGTE